MRTKCEHLHAVNPSSVLWLAGCCTALSALAALVFWADGHIRPVRGLSGAVGFMAGLIGSGVAFWFSIRARDPRLALAALLSLLPIAFWCWQIFQVMHP